MSVSVGLIAYTHFNREVEEEIRVAFERFR